MESQRMETRGIFSWQKKLLPLMIGMLAVLAFFFFVASFIQLYYLHSRIEDAPKLDLAQAFSIPDSGAAADMGRLDYSKWKALSILEGYSLQRRYHQANVLLMSRVWTRYLGFVTGMILAFVGAAFILGKLREPETKLDSEGVWKFSLTTASPGLILAVLGTLLMLATIVTHTEIEVTDRPLYTQAQFAQPQTIEAPPQPAPLPPKGEDIRRDMKKNLGKAETQETNK